MAVSRRSVKAGLVHHSDRGVQYAADDYTGLLDQHGIQISMSRKGNPYDNARTESFMKTLKYEEVYRQEYRDLPDALRSLRRFIEKVYNHKRLHSALGYLPPAEFEAHLFVLINLSRPLRGSFLYEFFQASGNLSIRCDSIGQ